MHSMWILVGLLGGCGAEQAPAPAEVPAPVPEVVAGLLHLGAEVEVTTIKNGTAPVVGRFAAAEGELHVQNIDTWEGLTGAIRVPLIQWDSGLAVRDERVRETFFRVPDVPRAVLELQMAQPLSSPLLVGATADVVLQATLSVGGPAVPVNLEVRLKREGERTYTFESTAPTKVEISALGLSSQLEALVTLCGHQSVADAVTIAFKGRLRD
jgi:hypothetical protein